MSNASFGDGGPGDEDGFRPGAPGAPAVLVIERTDATRRLIEQALRADYQVDAVGTYEQARRRAEENPYDGIVLSVYQRDVEAGIELMEALRAPDAAEGVPIILVCRPPLDRSEATLLDAGFDDVLRMPFAESELLDVVARHLPPS